jgi:hypothetical protein
MVQFLVQHEAAVNMANVRHFPRVSPPAILRVHPWVGWQWCWCPVAASDRHLTHRFLTPPPPSFLPPDPVLPRRPVCVCATVRVHVTIYPSPSASPPLPT